VSERAPDPSAFHAPVWDRGEAIDADMLAFTIGDDPLLDRRLVAVDLEGSLAHADGLLAAGLLDADDHRAIRGGLEELCAEHAAGAWTVEPGDEDVHSAVERRLTEKIGEAGKRLHTGRSRNDQVALDVRLWLRTALAATETEAAALRTALTARQDADGELPLPGYTHLRRAMPSSVGDWLGAYVAALGEDLVDFDGVRQRLRLSPLGSGAGYGVPLPLDRDATARALGFEGPEEPVTRTQLVRGRAELSYLTALDGIALTLQKLLADLWLFTTREFGFASLPVELTTGSSIMPQKRNPDLIELLRAHCRQIGADRSALREVLRDLPAGYHRDFQLVKPPLFRAHDRMQDVLRLATKLVSGLAFERGALNAAAADPDLAAVERALLRVRGGMAFRDAYRLESRAGGVDQRSDCVPSSGT